MAVAHNVYIRGLNAIYCQADNVTATNDKKDFLLFCKIWTETINHHHQLEEEIFFPRMEKQTGVKALMRASVEQHQGIHQAVDAFEKYLSVTDADTYDARKLKELVDGFGDLLTAHLHDEIDTLSDLEQYDKDGSITKEAYQAFEKRLVAESSWVWRS